ncbi:unnamed protein product [Ilex paraguariensis]|uniref:AP-5 complex subunit zeta-1 ARM repeats domain-containing protein n=1 Tax=Ilex paraguariensis TaxID=185542 RepID=A0ABC8S0B2_9AQUA
MVDREREWNFHLRSLSSSARDSNFANDPASDPSLLNSVKKLHEFCKSDKSEDLIARVYPQLNRIFQRSVSAISQSRTSNGILLLVILCSMSLIYSLALADMWYYSHTVHGFSCFVVAQAILQFFLDFGDVVLHDADPNLRTFFRSCLSR